VWWRMVCVWWIWRDCTGGPGLSVSDPTVRKLFLALLFLLLFSFSSCAPFVKHAWDLQCVFFFPGQSFTHPLFDFFLFRLDHSSYEKIKIITYFVLSLKK
jgi:hypothetical protein